MPQPNPLWSARFKHLLQSLASLAVLTVSSAQAAEPAPSTEEAHVEPETPEKRRSFAVLPGAFYSQETSVGFAALGMYTFPIRGSGPATWPSTITATLVYTLNNQASASVWTAIYLGEANDWAIETESFIEHFPTNYYGVGQDAEPSYELFIRRQLAIDATVRRRVKGDFYLGLADHLAFVDVRDVAEAVEPDGSKPVVWTDDDQLGSGNVTGAEGTRLHGLGLLARWDTRDNNQSAHRGALVDLELAGHPTWLGSRHPFALASLDLRGFAPVGRGTLAAQWITKLGAGSVPFTSMPELGGDDQLRGMFQGRFRDRSATTAQLELRHPIIWRFGGVLFAGAGQVGHDPEDLFAAPPRWTAGGGLRFVVDPQARTNIRLDMGAGPDGTGFMFTFGEAF